MWVEWSAGTVVLTQALILIRCSFHHAGLSERGVRSKPIPSPAGDRVMWRMVSGQSAQSVGWVAYSPA